MHLHGAPITIERAHYLVKRYIDAKDILAGRELYSIITEAGLQGNTFLGSFFIRLFSLSDSLAEAGLVFCNLVEPSVFSWTAIISALNQHGRSERAIKMYYQMQQANVAPDEYVFVGVLHACAVTQSLTLGKFPHVQIQSTSADWDGFIGNALIDMYAKCGYLDGALRVFYGLEKRDVVSWNAIITGYTQLGFSEKAFVFLHEMQLEDIKPSHVTFVSILKACCTEDLLDEGRLIHGQAIEEGFESGVILGSALTNMYAKCGQLADACRVLEKQPTRHTFIWNALVTGYAQNGDGEKAFQLFQKMIHNGFQPNEVTFVCTIKACTGMAAFDKGRHIHTLVVDSGVEQNSYVAGSLIDLYTASGNLDDARRVFDRVTNHDEITWSAIITGYAQHGCGEDALDLFQKMQVEGVKADLFTHVYVLKACTGMVAIDPGQLIYAFVVEQVLESDVCFGSALIDFYAKCGSLNDAISVFGHLPKKNLVVWSAMIGGFCQHGDHKTALQYFYRMREKGVKPDDVVLVSLLSTCAQMGLVKAGKQLFEAIPKDFGLIPNSEHYNCMVDLLGRAGRLNEAESLMELSPAESFLSGG